MRTPRDSFGPSGNLSGADDPVRRAVVADSHSQLRHPLPHRVQSPRLGQPTHQPRTGPSGKRRRGPAATAPGRHAELLLSRRLSMVKSRPLRLDAGARRYTRYPTLGGIPWRIESLGIRRSSCRASRSWLSLHFSFKLAIGPSRANIQFSNLTGSLAWALARGLAQKDFQKILARDSGRNVHTEEPSTGGGEL